MPAATGQATIQWNRYPQLRLGLCILYGDYAHIDGPQKVKIFNKVFAVELAACDFPSGVPDEDYEKVCVQWRDRRKEGNAHIWRDITISPSTEEGKAEVEALKKKVKDAAAELGFGGGLADLPTYDGSMGVGSVSGRGVRVAVKPQGSGSSSDEDSSGGASGDESEDYRGLGNGPPRVL